MLIAGILLGRRSNVAGREGSNDVTAQLLVTLLRRVLTLLFLLLIFVQGILFQFYNWFRFYLNFNPATYLKKKDRIPVNLTHSFPVMNFAIINV
jgi:hypothetical protein